MTLTMMVTKGYGTWQHRATVIGRWSDSRSPPTVHSALVAQVLFTIEALNPPVARLTSVDSQLLRVMVFLEMNQSTNISSLVFFPEGRMGVEVTRS